MTCIVGIEKAGQVWIGGDSASLSGLSKRIREDSKVFKVGDVLFGFTTSFRVGQLLRFSLTIPPQKVEDDYQYLCTDFIDAVRKCLKNGGFTHIKDNQEIGGTFLLGYKGRLYTVDSDFQVGKVTIGFDACGCGEDYALGSLYTTKDLKFNPEERLIKALKAAAQFSAGVAPPFKIISSKNKK